jgi:uncharacterized tellurite resistance protein B-like protein
MYSEKFFPLRSEYEQERNLKFNEEQFLALLYTLPAILIASADGRVDENEKRYMQNIPSDLLAAYRNENYNEVIGNEFSQSYFTEVQYLIEHITRWKDKFIEALRDELNNKLNDKNAIYEMMWKTAYSSENVSDNEIRMLKKLTKALGF